MNFVSFHFGDYYKSTLDLSWDEDLALRRLLDQYYIAEGPLPLDRNRIFRLARAQSASQKKAVEAVLHQYFTLSAEGWRNQRCDEELIKYREKSEKAKKSAKIRWEPDLIASAEESGADDMRTLPPQRNVGSHHAQCSWEILHQLQSHSW